MSAAVVQVSDEAFTKRASALVREGTLAKIATQFARLLEADSGELEDGQPVACVLGQQLDFFALQLRSGAAAVAAGREHSEFYERLEAESRRLIAEQLDALSQMKEQRTAMRRQAVCIAEYEQTLALIGQLPTRGELEAKLARAADELDKVVQKNELTQSVFDLRTKQLQVLLLILNDLNQDLATAGSKAQHTASPRSEDVRKRDRPAMATNGQQNKRQAK